MAEQVVGNDGLLFCKECGEKIERFIDYPLFDGTGRAEPRKVRVQCRCEKEARIAYENRMKFEEEKANIAKLRKLSLMDDRLKDARFSTYKTNDDNRKVFDIARRYVLNFEDMYKAGQGLLLWGNVGTGKSYTTAVIANELLERQVSVIMTSFIKLVDKMSKFDSEDDGYMDGINRAKLLIVDDLGANRGTDTALEKVYDIIDSRYRSKKPMIITTNISFTEMKNCDDIRYSRIYDRIFEMCYPVRVEGTSWRKKEAVARFESMKKILEG